MADARNPLRRLVLGEVRNIMEVFNSRRVLFDVYFLSLRVNEVHYLNENKEKHLTTFYNHVFPPKLHLLPLD